VRRMYNDALSWSSQSPELARLIEPMYLCPSSPADSMFVDEFLGPSGLNLPIGDTFAALHYAFSKGTSDAWCVSGAVAHEQRGLFELNRKTAIKDIIDGTGHTLAMGEADTSADICHGPGCSTAAAPRRAVQAWLSGTPGYDFLVGHGFIIASAYASTTEPLNKSPVTDTYIAISGLSDCRSSLQGGPHGTSNYRSAHPGGGNFALTDGSCRFESDAVDLKVYRALSTIQGEEMN
jgi:hypothetical protein